MLPLAILRGRAFFLTAIVLGDSLLQGGGASFGKKKSASKLAKAMTVPHEAGGLLSYACQDNGSHLLR